MGKQENRYVAYCEFLVKGLCDVPGNVVVDKKVDEQGVLLEVSGIDRNDMGNLIGAKGVHINAIRQLVRVVGAMEKAKVSVKLVEPEGSEFRPRTGY